MIFNNGKSNVKYGALFEEVFKTILDANGFKEGVDYIKTKPPEPDFYFKKSKTYIEIKFISSGGLCYGQEQKKRMAQLIKKGYKIKVLFFEIKIEEPFRKNTSIRDLLKNL